jgi:metal-sulfur cluster biosynthetic enzyme
MDTTDPAPTAAPSPSQGLSEDQVRSALRRVKDPELNLNIVDLGLIYEVEVTEGRSVHVEMTLTSPGCPSGPEIMSEAQRVIESLEGVGSVDIELVWSPYWTPERIDPRLRAFLGG